MRELTMGERSLAVIFAKITSNRLMIFDRSTSGTGNEPFDRTAAFKIRLYIPHLRIYYYLRSISDLLIALRSRGGEISL
jgi:hypothetical protein